MKKIILSIATLLAFGTMLVAQEKTDSTAYVNRKLKLDEIDFVQSYYTQEGDHSAVTGGIGDEHLNDFSTNIEVKLSKIDQKLRKHTFNAGIGFDAYTSASSDNIDPSTVSSASSKDIRFYPSLGWQMENPKNNTTIGANLMFSGEYDYTSIGAGLSFVKSSEDQNREFSIKAQVFMDQWKVILPVELKNQPSIYDSNEPRNTYNLSLGYSQVINKKLQASILGEFTYQTGLLGTAYQRVYFTNGTMNHEVLPDNRFKLPIGIRANYFMTDRVILRSFYRYYWDDWGISAHTVSLEVPIKISPYFSVAPFYRYYTQTAADYFAPYKNHLPTEEYYTSDYDLSEFSSNYVGANMRWVPENGLFGIKKMYAGELRYGYYKRDDGLYSHNITLALTFK